MSADQIAALAERGWIRSLSEACGSTPTGSAARQPAEALETEFGEGPEPGDDAD